MRFTSLLVAATATFSQCLAASSGSQGEVPAIRTYFMVGGGYVDDGAGGEIFRDQMYVERLVPTKGPYKSTPLVFIHGQAQTGTVSPLHQCYETASADTQT
jgi:hypothetical protein